MAWSKISLPLSEGGLGIKCLEDWNQALILLRLWKIVNFSRENILIKGEAFLVYADSQ